MESFVCMSKRNKHYALVLDVLPSFPEADLAAFVPREEVTVLLHSEASLSPCDYPLEVYSSLSAVEVAFVENHILNFFSQTGKSSNYTKGKEKFHFRVWNVVDIGTQWFETEFSKGSLCF